MSDMHSETTVTHFHMAGRDACPHAECVAAEGRRVDRATAVHLAKTIQAKLHHEVDVQRLADLTLRLLV